MPAKIVLSVYVDVEKDNEEVSAMVSDLVGRLGGNIVNKPTKRRKRSPMTDEEKAAFRARMVAGREAKAKADEEAAIDEKAELDSDKNVAIAEAKATKTNSKPKTGQKDKAKPATK